jgi:hypothetical protein
MGLKKDLYHNLVRKVEQLDAVITLMTNSDDGESFEVAHPVVSTALNYASDTIYEIRKGLENLSNN